MLGPLIDFFFPKSCPACKVTIASEELLCLPCWIELRETNFERFPNNKMEMALWGKIGVQSAQALFYFESQGRVQKILHAIKYYGNDRLARELGRYYGFKLNNLPNSLDRLGALVPVPLHPQKLKKRGFNQALAFAEGISQTTGIPLVTNLVERKHFTESQTRKDRETRWRNVKQVFQVFQSPETSTLTIVDDVFTSGATVLSMAKCLERAGVAHFHFLSLAYANKE